MGVKISCEGFWEHRATRVEGDSVAEVRAVIKELERNGGFEPTHSSERTNQDHGKLDDESADYPVLSGDKGCTNAIRELLGSSWGKSEPRTEHELTSAMKANAIHYSHGTISGVLTQLTQRRGEIRRVGKKNGSYAYAISNAAKNPEHPEVLVTA